MSINKKKETIVNELHRNVRINFRRRKYVQKGIGDTFQADLVDMSPYSDVNRGYKYLLTAIDIFSKVGFAVGLKTKSTVEVTKAFKRVLDTFGKPVKNVMTDRGTEFISKEFKRLMEERKINFYNVTTKIKAGICERFNKTLKNLMYKNFGYQGSYNWIDHIDELINKYNNTKHSTIKMAPNKVRKKHEKQLLRTIYNRVKVSVPTKLKEGNHVRISDLTGTFRRGFRPNWSAGIFRINKVQNTDPVTFKLIDYNDRPVKRTFYQEEIQRVKYPDIYLVEKILRKKGNKALIKWLGFDDSYNSWEYLNNIVI